MTVRQSAISVDAEGLDAHACAIITFREPPVSEFLANFLGASIDDYDAKANPVERPLSKAFTLYEAQQTKPREDVVAHQNARAKWRDEVLFPLAEQLDAIDRAYRVIALQCLKHKCFDHQHGNRYLHPELNDVLPKILDVLHVTDTIEHRTSRLLETLLCPDRERALFVAHAYKGPKFREVAAGIARHLLLHAIHYGRVGLLASSDYPYASTLLRLENYASYMNDVATSREVVMALLRADLIALQKVFLEQKCNKRSLWHENLLHWKATDPARLHFLKECVKPRLKEVVIHNVMTVRGLTRDESINLVTALLHNGIAAIIDWRRASTNETLQLLLEDQRIERLVRHHLDCLDQASIATVRSMLKHLRDAVATTGISVSFHPLLSEYPNNEYRRKRKAELGLHFNKRLSDQGRALRNEFQRRTGHTQGMARKLLADFYSYGGIGLIPPEQRAKAISRAARDVLHFFKLARVDATAEWVSVLRSVNAHLASLGLPKLSSQVGRAVYFQLDKPARWHYGAGEATDPWARVRWQVDSTPRIHRAWYAVSTSFSLNLIDEAHHPLSDTCYVVIMLDADSELPAGLWASYTPITERELGLALYQSIWHPGKPNWQIRGTPTTIYLPASVQFGESNALSNAAQHLLLKLDGYENERFWRQKALVKQIHEQGTEVASRRRSSQRVTLRQTQDRLLRWIHELAFGKGRPAGFPNGLSTTKLAMPAHTWVAAGWLLPATEQLTTISGGVIRNSMFYTNAATRITPGQTVQVREYPYIYTADDSGFFINGSNSLYYIIPSNNGANRDE